MNNWIRVEDRLPEYGVLVLVVAENSGNERIVEFGRFLASSEHDWDVGREVFVSFNEVTHWMPLPEPPQD